MDLYNPPPHGDRITFANGRLQVPNYPIIPFIEGDGIGPDIWAATSRVLDAAVAACYRGERQICWYEVYAGAKAQEIFAEWLPVDTLTAIQDYRIALKGPLTTPVGGGIRSLNVALRQELDLYVCLRPIRYFSGVPSPVKRPQDVDMVVFRENTEDIYAGIEWEAGSVEVQRLIDFLHREMGVTSLRFPASAGIGIKPVSRQGTERLVRAALEYALIHGRRSVTLVHKGNIMKYTEGAFKNWGYQLAEREFKGQVFTYAQYDQIKDERGQGEADRALGEAEATGKVIVKDVIADAFLQQVLTRAASYDVIATLNLNGDYISDALAAQVGGIGIAPGANINYQTGHAIFEATHGTAPKYTGLDKVNPGSLILSGCMMLRHLGWEEAADRIEAALDRTIADKIVTYDLARLMEGAQEVRCSAFADRIIYHM